jgi:flagellum-specific ATP synthase
VLKAVSALSAHAKSRDLVEVGAYRPGMNPELDAALRLVPEIEGFMRQGTDESHARDDAMARLRQIIDGAAKK